MGRRAAAQHNAGFLRRGPEAERTNRRQGFGEPSMHDVIERVAAWVEALAVLIIVGGIAYSILRYFLSGKQAAGWAYRQFKNRIGNSLLLGLEFLVAADIIRTVALERTLLSVVVLAVLVLVRTFLSWALVIEIEGRWPWQRKPAEAHDIRG
jgi:uncharacterized membrane protein